MFRRRSSSIISALMVALGAIVVSTGAQSRTRVTVIAYGDTRFTNPANVTATNPFARTALIAQIAVERPDAVVISGDVPWHGGVPDDYAQFRRETDTWRALRIPIIPALGNHEFSQCEPQTCLENWWTAFPELRGRRWHAADVGPHVRIVALDTMSPLTAGSEQRAWLEHEIEALPAPVDFLIVTLHHPPVADIQTRLRMDHNPRPNELALADYLSAAAMSHRVRIIVVAGHIHNYERFLRDDVVYLVSGGGGAVPYEVDRTPSDLHKGIDFPNFHYVKLAIANGTLNGTMHRLDEPTAPAPHFTVKDSFELPARPSSTQRP
jgi:3',5'-cyclic AMP phosphodiesterase CpdA